MIKFKLCNFCMCLFTVLLKGLMYNGLMKKFSRNIASWFYSCLDTRIGNVLGPLSNPSLRTLSTLLVSLYPAASRAFVCIVIMPMFIVMGQHLIVGGILEAQMQDDCQPYDEVRREICMFHSICFNLK